MLYFLALLFFITISLWILLSNSKVQSDLANRATYLLKETYDVDIKIKRLDFSFFGSALLYDVLLRDHKGDTMIYVPKLKADLISIYNIKNSKLEFNSVEMHGVEFYMRKYKKEKSYNITKFIRQFKTKKKKKPFVFKIKDLEFYDSKYLLIDYNKSGENIVSYENINFEVEDLLLDGPEFYCTVLNSDFSDNFGFYYSNMSTKFYYSPTQMKFIDTYISTIKSNVLCDVYMNYKPGDFFDFYNKVKLDLDLKQSKLSGDDLYKFYNKMPKKGVYFANLKLSGVLNSFLLKDIEVKSNKVNEFYGDIYAKNIFSNKKDFAMNITVNKLLGDIKTLDNVLPVNISNKIKGKFDKIGSFYSIGVVDLFKDKINLKIDFSSDIGRMKSDIILNNFSDLDSINYIGNIGLDSFNIGYLFDKNNIGEVNFKGYIEGKGISKANIKAKLEGEIYSLYLNGYNYTNGLVNGFLENEQFNGELIIDDENFKMNFKGIADLSSNRYVYKFESDIEKMNLYALNISKKDINSDIKGFVSIDAQGNNIDDIVGSINFKNTTYKNSNDVFYFKNFSVFSSIKDSIKTLEINSKDIINGSIRGRFLYKDLTSMVKNSFGNLYKNHKNNDLYSNKYFRYNFKIHSKFISAIYPEVKVGANTSLRGKVTSNADDLELYLKSPYFVYKDIEIRDISFQIDNDNPLFNVHVYVDNVKSDKYDVSEFNLMSIKKNDTLFTKTYFYGAEKRDSFDLDYYLTFDEDNNWVLGFMKTLLNVKNKKWYLNEQGNKANKIKADLLNKQYYIDDIVLSLGDESIKIYGDIKGESNVLNLELNKVKLEDIVSTKDNFKLKGEINGLVKYYKINNKGAIRGSVAIDKLKINNEHQGDFKISFEPNKNVNNLYWLKVDINDKSRNLLKGKGIIDINEEIPKIDLDFNILGLKLDGYSPLGGNVLSEIKGSASGELRVFGDIVNPNIEGYLDLKNTSLSVPYLNVNYLFEQNTHVILDEHDFYFDNEIIEEKTKTKGILSGYISHSRFSDWYLNIDIESERLLALNTTESDNNMYYGQGYFKGSASIKGNSKSLDIYVDGETLAGTTLTLPLDNSSGLSRNSLIKFKTKKEVKKDRVAINKRGLYLNFDIDINEGAVGKIIIDNVSGSYIKGSGIGRIQVDVSRDGDINMLGSFRVTKGEYVFKYRKLIVKPFEIVEGGRVTWDGAPTDANIDIEAIHKIKANPKPVLDNYISNRLVDVHLSSTFSGPLFNSVKELDIKLPNLNSSFSSELDFKLNEDQTFKMKQFASLIIAGIFVGDQNTNAGSTVLSGTTSDIATTFMENMLNSYNSKLRVGFNYTAEDTSLTDTESTGSQFDFSLATEINDRMIINGRVGVPVGSSTQSSLLGEVNLEYKINKEGNFRTNIFNRPNQIYYTLEEEGYTRGIGLSYQVNFNNWNEFLRKLFPKKEKDSVK